MNKNLFHQQAELLISILPYMTKDTDFALHGGTAINFFVRDMPRISVDIDLTYLHLSPREETIKAISDQLKSISKRISSSMPSVMIEEKAGLSKGLISDELDFLAHHILDPINMSDTMTEEEFQQLKVDILKTYLLYDKCVSPSKINRIDGLYEIHVKCPYCKITSVYRNYSPPTKIFDHRAIVCRNCMMRFWIVTRYYKAKHILSKIVYRIIGYKRLAYLKKIFRVLKSFFSYAHQWREKDYPVTRANND